MVPFAGRIRRTYTAIRGTLPHEQEKSVEAAEADPGPAAGTAETTAGPEPSMWDDTRRNVDFLTADERGPSEW